LYSATPIGYHPTTQSMHMHTPTAQSTPHGHRGGLKGTARATTSVGYLLLTEELSRRTSNLEDRPGRAVYPLCAPPQTGSYRGLEGDAFGGRAIGRQHGWPRGLQPHLRAIATTPGSVRSSLVRFAIGLVWPWVRFGRGFGSAVGSVHSSVLFCFSPLQLSSAALHCVSSL
jgi:hypothetical protein